MFMYVNVAVYSFDVVALCYVRACFTTRLLCRCGGYSRVPESVPDEMIDLLREICINHKDGPDNKIMFVLYYKQEFVSIN
jgi:hypothetical protein